MKTYYQTLIFSFLFFQVGFSQDCACDFIISAADTHFNGELMGVVPGDVICIKSGERGGIKIRNISGTTDNPVIIKNCGGPVIIIGYSSGGMQIESSSNFKLTGTGSYTTEYGIHISGSHENGLVLTGKSTDFEVDHIEISNTKNYAIRAFTDPTCDLTANLGYFTMANTNFNHLNIHHCDGGILIGHPNFNSPVLNPFCGALQPHDVSNVNIAHSKINNMTKNAIVLNGFSGDIENNLIRFVGGIGVYSRFAKTVSFEKNIISYTGAEGVKSDGAGLYSFTNNLLFKNGGSSVDAISLAFSSPLVFTHPNALRFINNTVVNAGRTNLFIANASKATESSYIQNNILAGTNGLIGAPPVIMDSSAFFTLTANIMTNESSIIEFKNVLEDDFRLTHISPAFNGGIDVDFVTDITDGFRKLAGAVDIGAFEYIPEPLAYFNKMPLVGLYVDGFKNILGDTEAEETLLNYAKDNGFNYLLLYNLSHIHAHTYNLTVLEEANVLANFIYRAKTEFGMAQVGAVGEKSASFDKIEVYNSFYPDWFKKIDVLNLEFEFWANTEGATFDYYCSNYLLPNGYDCTNKDAFKFYAIELEAIDQRAHKMGIISEIYLGSPTKDEMIELCEISDRILIHYYRSTDTYGDGKSIYNYHPDRLRAMALSDRKPAMMPIFSSRTAHMGPWLIENSLHKPMETWLNGKHGYYTDMTPGLSEVKIAGFQWYRYTSFQDLLPSFYYRGQQSGPEDNKRGEIQLNDYAAYPTMVNNELNLIASDDTNLSERYCAIYDSKGSLMLNMAFTTQFNTFDVGFLATGLYYLNVIQDGAVVYTQKIVK